MKAFHWLMAALAVLGLIAVRVLESRIFYDPFLDYFHGLDKAAVFPNFSWCPLIFSHLLRFALNLVLSAVIVQNLFRNRTWTLQACMMIVLAFAITFPLYLYCLQSRFAVGVLFSFYVRRFVIQPLLLLLIIPLFYYRKETLERES